MRGHDDLVGCEGDERPAGHCVVRDEDRDLAFAFADGTRDLRRGQDQPSRSVQHQIHRHLGIHAPQVVEVPQNRPLAEEDRQAEKIESSRLCVRRERRPEALMGIP